MAQSKTWGWVGGVYAVSVIAAGVPYWLAPYNSDAQGTLLGWGMMVVVAGAALAIAVGRAPVLVTGAVMSSLLPVVVMLRVVVETTIDPTSHNLWPFEVFIAVVMGVTAAVVGAGLGWAILRAYRS